MKKIAVLLAVVAMYAHAESPNVDIQRMCKDRARVTAEAVSARNRGYAEFSLVDAMAGKYENAEYGAFAMSIASNVYTDAGRRDFRDSQQAYGVMYRRCIERMTRQ